MNIAIKQACKLLEEGKLVCFPTETVYALAAKATDINALQDVYRIKGRDFKKPLAIMAKDTKQAQNYVKFNKVAMNIAEKFCPGPLSLVLPKLPECKLPEIINSGMETLSVRIPDHDIALSILNNLKCPVVATSANPSGMPDAANASEVKSYFQNDVAMIIEGNGCTGKASTVVDLCQDEPKILREGEVSINDILKYISL